MRRRRVQNNIIHTKFTKVIPVQNITGIKEYPLTLGILSPEQQRSIQSFSQFKLNAVRYTFTPRQNVAGATVGITSNGDPPTYTTGMSKPTILTLFDRNRDNKYDFVFEVTNNPRHRRHNPFRTITRYTKIIPQLNVNMDSTSLVDMTPARNPWISTRDLQGNFGRLIWAKEEVDQIDVPDIAEDYSLHVTYYVSLKNLN